MLGTDDASLTAAAAVIKNGGIVAYPTETFYGLAADPFNEDAVETLFILKGRDKTNPISLIAADTAMVKKAVSYVSPLAEVLMHKYWPGPLTIVFDAAPSIPEVITAGTGKVGIRIPSSKTALELTRLTGHVVTTTSANPSGKAPASTASEAMNYFHARIDAIIDGGELTSRLASTIVDAAGDTPLVIREGVIASKEILKTTGGSR